MRAPDLVAPRFCWVPDHDQSWGIDAVDLAAMAGLILDAEQRLILDATFARQGNRFAARDVAVISSRQNLKTVVLQAGALADLFLFDVRLIVWTAHLFDTAQEAFRDIVNLIDGCPEMRREVKTIHRARGDEGVELISGARLNFMARSKSSGRGLSGDRVILDEALALGVAEMGALLPALSARPDPQVRYGSSAGKVDSHVLRSVRDRGRAGGDPSLAYLEWCDLPGGCAEPDCDHRVGARGCALDDEDRWRASNPAMGRRIDVEDIRAERRSLDPVEFARERMGWWEDPIAGGAVIDAAVWASRQVGRRPVEAPVFAVELSLDRSRAVVGAAWDSLGRRHVEVVEDRSGCDWVIPRLVELTAKHSSPALVLDAGTEAWSLAAEAEAAGLAVMKVTGIDRASACGAFHDAVVTGALSHDGNPALAAAILAARWKDVGDGARAFSRRRSTADIKSLYAVTLALHGLTRAPAAVEADFFLL